MTRRTYRNPPIVEAIVEFRFVPSQEWDLTIPGKVHEHPAIRNDYRGKPRTQGLIEASIEPQNPPAFALRQRLGRIQLVSDDGLRLVALGQDVMSVNVLRPYDGWDRFRPRVEAALNAYREVAAPQAVSRVGVRYINRLVFPAQLAELPKYLCYGPPLAKGLPTRFSTLLNRVEYEYEDSCRLILTQATVDGAPEGSTSLILDLDVVCEQESIDLNAAIAVADDLHEREGSAFESVVTDESRRLFDGN